MITRFSKIDGEEYGFHPDNTMVTRDEYFGKSGDTKPIEGVTNADVFYEMDTKKIYLFDADDKVWLAQ